MKLLAPFRRIDWRLIVIFFMVAAIVHIITTFMAVNDQRGAAYARLARALPLNQMSVLDPITPERQLLPFLAPDARYALCPFETSAAPMRVKAVLPDVGWTIGIYKSDGTSVYFAAAAAERETVINLAIIPTDDRFLGLSPQSLGRESEPTQLTVAAPKGLVVVRGPDRGPPYESEIRTTLAKASCVSGRV